MKKRITMMFFYIMTFFSGVIFAQVPVITIEPSPRGVIIGQTAAFSVEASGSDLSYQWFKEDTLISGAIDSIYTTPPTVSADNGDDFKVIVSNIDGSDTSITVRLYVTSTGSRVNGAIIVLYDFKQRTGNQVIDVAGTSDPLDLTINNTSLIDWSNNGLFVKDGALINSSVSAGTSRIISDIQSNDEMTIEMWLRPSTVQTSRAIEFSTSPTDVNFFIENLSPSGYNFFVRTTATNNQGSPGLLDTEGLTQDLVHLTATRSAEGVSRIYRNGVEVGSRSIGGDLSNWNTLARLSLGSSLNGTKPWSGIYYLVAIFERALDSVEVAHNFSKSLSGIKAPFIIEQPENNQILEGFSANFQIRAVGSTPFTYKWQKNGIDIPGAIDSFYTTPPAASADSGTIYRVIATNAFGSDTSDNAIVEVRTTNPDCPAGITNYYHLDESTSPYNNSIGFAVGTSSTPPASVPGVVSIAQQFSNPQKIDIPDDITFDWAFNQSISIEFWMKTSSIPSGINVMIGRDDAVSPLQWWVALNSNGKVDLLLRNINNEGSSTIGNKDPAVNDDNWHLITAVSDASVDKNYLYIDGNKVDSAAVNYTAGFESGAPVNVAHLTSGFYYNGSLDEMATYNAALSQTEIQNHYNKGLAGLGYCDIPFIVEPKNLTAEAKFKKVELAWQDSSNNEDGFIIERKYGGFDFTVIDSVLANDSSFTDSSVVDTTNYNYRVKGYNLLGESNYSNTASVTTLLSTLNAPTSLTAVLSPTFINHAELNWQDNSSNELGFIVERKTGDSASVEPFSVLDTLIADVTSFEDSTLADTTTYTFRVKAFNTFTGSDYSNLAWVTTILSTVAAPGSLTAIVNPADTNNVLLSWVDNSPNELGFIIERKTGDSSSVDPYLVIDSVAADVISYEDTTVADTTTYTYKVQAFNEFAVSDYSNQAEVTTPVPVELTSFTAGVTDKYVQLDWETATELNNSGFSIQRSKNNNKFTDLAFVKGKGTTTTQSLYSYTDKSVLSGKYYYRLKQVDFDGSVTYSKSTGVDLGLPKDYALEQNYPNPFNPSTTIRFALPINAQVNIKLYNTLGQEVVNIFNGELSAGIHETVFNASNLSSGVYFYMLKVQGANGSNFTSTKRMILMK